MRRTKRPFTLGIERLEPRLTMDAKVDFLLNAMVGSESNAVNNVTAGRFDSDNHIDLVVSNVGPFGLRSIEVFKGNGTGQFSSVERYGVLDNVFQTRIVDIDGDGDSDLMGLSLGPLTEDHVSIFEGNGTGDIIERAARPNSILTWDGLKAFDIADLDLDGNLDVIMVGTNGIQLRYGTGGLREFRASPLQFASQNASLVKVGDFNSDLRPDFIVGAEFNGVATVEVYLNRVDGSFVRKFRTLDSGTHVADIQLGDFLGDGTVQYAVLHEDNVALKSKIQILRYDETNNAFQILGTKNLPFDTGDTVNAMTIADFDLDAKLDIAITRRGTGADAGNGSFVVVTLVAPGVFSNVQPTNFEASPGRKIITADFNGDAKPDVAVVRQSSADVAVYLNRSIPQNIVRGAVFDDLNRNGRFDSPVESGLGNRTVFADANDNGLFDVGESSTVTRSGSFRLAVPDGRYTLRLLPKTRWVQSLPYHPSSQAYGGYLIDVRNRENLSGTLFGSYLLGNVQGVAFRDLNNNRNFDIIESGLTESIIFADYDNDSEIDANEPQVVPRQDGEWGLNVTPGTHFIRIKSEGRLFSTIEPETAVRINNENDVVTGLVFGQTPPATIEGTVYYDRFVDGIFNEREESGQGGFQLFLDFNNNTSREANEPIVTTSNSNDPSLKGRYKFEGNYAPGNYVVRLIKPNGFEQTAPTRAGSGTGGSANIFAKGGTSFVNFGVYRPIFVSGTVFKDSNGNGVQNANEQPLADIPVFIDYNNNGLVDDNEPVTVTSASGTYQVASSQEGSFRVRAAGRSGQTATVPNSATRTVTFAFGTAFTERNFGFAEGAFSTAPYANPINIPVDRNPVALVSGDFNRDGNADFIVTTNSGTSQVFLGQGNGSFNQGQTFDSGSFTRMMLARDLTGDGVLDLITANDDEAARGIAIMIGNANGTFQAKQTFAGIDNTYGIAIGNFDGVGPLDVAFVGASEPRVGVVLNGGFSQPIRSTNNPSGGGRSIATADLNGDNLGDLVVANHGNNSVSVLLGKGDGTFNVGVPVVDGIAFPNFVSLADLNRDGRFDLVASNEFSNEVRVFLGIGNGRFRAGTTYAVGPTPQQIAVLDIDQDRNLDLIVSYRSDGTTNISGGVSILRGRGDGTFVEQQVRTAHTSPAAVAIADFNKDGQLDIVAANFFSDDVSYLRNVSTPAPGAIRGAAFVDANQNGNARVAQETFSGLRVFVDLNRNGRFDTTEPWTRTSDDGEYVLANLPAGSYDVRIESDEQRVQTLPVGRGANRVVVRPGETQSSKNFSLTAIQTADGLVLDDRSASYRGSWTRVTSANSTGQSYIHDGNALKGSKTITFDIRVPDAGYYAVAMKWNASSNRASNVPVEVKSGTNTHSFNLNQRSRGNRFNDVGVYYFNTSGGSITLKTNGTNGFVTIDAIRLVAVEAPPTQTIDNTSSGVSVRGSWTQSTNGLGYIGNNYLTDGNPATKGAHSVIYTPNLATNGVYEIFARWVGDNRSSSRVVYDVTTANGTVRVVMNQRINSGKWTSLGFFRLNTSDAKVTIRNTLADGTVVADGLRFTKVL